MKPGTTTASASGEQSTGDQRLSIVDRLHEEAQRLMGEAWQRSDIHPLGMSANLAMEAADTIKGLRAALEALEAAELAHANCDECEGEGVPELCEKCFPLFDDARVMRRTALASDKE